MSEILNSRMTLTPASELDHEAIRKQLAMCERLMVEGKLRAIQLVMLHEPTPENPAPPGMEGTDGVSATCFVGTAKNLGSILLDAMSHTAHETIVPMVIQHELEQQSAAQTDAAPAGEAPSAQHGIGSANPPVH